MAPSFSKEAILQGSIDHLCLVCERYLRSEREVSLHVSTPAHNRNLDSTDYMDKYRHDRVRKVKKWYLCEFCNVLVYTKSAVGLHVEETRHKENKASQMMTRDCVEDVILSGDIAVSEDAWHGLIDENTCITCNVEYENKEVHKSESIHVINLIHSKVIHIDKNAYRKLDDTTFQCLACNEVVTEITAHHKDTKHKELIQQCTRRTNISKRNVDDHTKSITCNAKGKNETNEEASHILDSIGKFQTNSINVNFEARTAVCKKCSVNIKFNCKDIENHIYEHNIQKTTKNIEQKKSTSVTSVLFGRDEINKTKDNKTLFTSPVFRNTDRENKEGAQTKPEEPIKQRSGDDAVQKIAEEYGLTYTPVGNKVYCQMCNKHIIPAEADNIVGHVNGKLHKNITGISVTPTNLKQNKSVKENPRKINLQRLPLHQFTRTRVHIKTHIFWKFISDIILNEKYCIDILSFLYLTSITRSRVRCQVCEVNLPSKDINDHLDTEKHKRAMKEIPVIIKCNKTELHNTEFIREVRSGIFQCGFCNIYDSWEGMETHLKSMEHKASKTFADWRLSEHLPKIREREIQDEYQKYLMHLLLTTL